MDIKKIIKRLGATDGKNGSTWDPEILLEFAQACKSGVTFGTLGGGPELQAESEKFRAEWKDIQDEIRG